MCHFMWLKAMLSARTMLSACGRASLLCPHLSIALIASKPQQILVKYMDFSARFLQVVNTKQAGSAALLSVAGHWFTILFAPLAQSPAKPAPSQHLDEPPRDRDAAPSALPVQPRFCSKCLIMWQDEHLGNPRQMGFGWLCGEQKCF